VVQPEQVRLTISDGEFIDVKKALNAGEYFTLLTDMADRKPFSKLLSYLIGWSFIGPDGAPLPYSLELPESHRRDTLRSLDTATMRELISVIDKHEEAEEKASEAKKKTSDGVIASSPISASPSDAGGITTPSIN